MNKFKEKEQTTEKKSKADNKENMLTPSVRDVFNGNFLSKENIVKNVSYLFFLTFLLICYIGYGYYSDKISSRIAELKNENQELVSEQHTSNKDLNLISLQSRIADSTDVLGLKESVDPPIKIIVPKGYLTDAKE
jgi:hypothetical protein